MLGAQLSLFGGGPPAFDPPFATARRAELGQGAWLDHVRGWVSGHEALFAILEDAMRWRSERRVMYERVVDVPRLLAHVPEDGDGHPLLGAMASALSDRYGARFDAVTNALNRGGNDSVAWHRDKGLRDQGEAFVCVLSLGGVRRFMLRPFGGGRSTSLSVGWGDLAVMGGTCQRTFEHCIPKLRHAEPRLAIMFRHSSPLAG
jgi:alkylated DNA repair dioxygenase AlkB